MRDRDGTSQAHVPSLGTGPWSCRGHFEMLWENSIVHHALIVETFLFTTEKDSEQARIIN